MNEADYTILIVDDNEPNRDILSRRIARKGYAVSTAEDGYQALGAVEKEPIDLIILDIMMPGITGLDVLKILRQNHPPAELPIIMATAKDQNEDMLEAFDLGANDYVTKPINFPVLLARVQAQLRMKSATSETETSVISRDLTSEEIQPGLVLAERYHLESKIGEGGFGTVYRAQHLGLQHPVAVKILNARTSATPDAIARFQREGIMACRVQHPNAVSIYDFGVTPGGTAYLVMELLVGHALDKELAQHGKLTPARCAEILIPICEVLSVAHADGIIHRDLKPPNIFLHQARQGEVVKVVDFGIAKLMDIPSGDAATTQGLFAGTPNYMAPERLSDDPYDGRSDMYGLGVMAYEMLCGRVPFQPKDSNFMALIMMHLQTEPPPVREINPEVPEAVEAVVMQALRKEPEQRPTAEEFADRFSQAVRITSW